MKKIPLVKSLSCRCLYPIVRPNFYLIFYSFNDGGTMNDLYWVYPLNITSPSFKIHV